ncbi:MAG: hypothetical protein J2P33_03395 [Actinobacteria bacterium]|nr:hypothetical protein [Actinomycetota bacterium]
MNPQELLLAPASRLVHIGPHKTGTTSIQTAFHVGRTMLSQHGVHYAGQQEQPLLAALAVAGGGGMRGQRPARPEDWTDLVDEVREAGDQRVVVSSEFLSYADDAAARRVVTELIGGPVHVVITLRPIYKIAPSQWQQYVQNGLQVPYDKWLDGMFRRPPYDQPTPSFWRRHKQDELVRRWAGVAGDGNLTVVVADESNPGLLLRTFEAFVGLPEGSLVPTKNAANRSLTFAEIELIRRINVEFFRREWPDPDEVHARFVRHGAARRMKRGREPAPGEPRLPMPKWALERSAEVGAETVETVRSLGVRAVGNLATLAEVPDKVADDDELTAVPLLPGDAVSFAVLGAIVASGRMDRATEAQFARAISAVAVRPEDEETAANGGLPDLPPVPADAAALAVLNAISVSAAVTPVRKKVARPTDVPVEQRLVRAVSALDLLRVVMQRGRRRLRRQPGG